MQKIRIACVLTCLVASGGLGSACRSRATVARDAAGNERSPRAAAPAVTCMVYRPCGCQTMCAGITIPREQLAPGVELPIVAGDACGARARVETALDHEGHVTMILGSAEPCDHRCAMAVLQAVDPTMCLGRCDRCPPGDAQ